MRPRRFRTPAISAGANGTIVRRSGTKTSCTRRIGSPNNCPPIEAVTYSLREWSAVSLMAHPLCRPIDVGLLFKRSDQALPVELGDIVVEANATASFNGLGGDHRRQGDD